MNHCKSQFAGKKSFQHFGRYSPNGQKRGNSPNNLKEPGANVMVTIFGDFI
jgi:hypothetical protein